MRSRSGRPDGGGGGPDGAPSSPSFGRRWRPRRRPFLSLLRPAWRPQRRHGGPGGSGGSGARCGALFLLSQINGGSCPSHTRTLADPRRRWRAAGDGCSSAHGGEQRRGGSTAGRRLPPTQSTAAQIRWSWRPPRPFLSLRRCGGLELRRIQSTAAAGSRFSAARIQAHVGFFSFLFVFPERLTAAGKAVRRGKPRFTVAFRRRRTGLPAAGNPKCPTRINIL